MVEMERGSQILNIPGTFFPASTIADHSVLKNEQRKINICEIPSVQAFAIVGMVIDFFYMIYTQGMLNKMG